MSRILTAVLPSFFALLMVCGALLTLVVSIFNIGTHEFVKQQIQQDGFWPYVGLRFVVAGTVGLVLALICAALSLVFRRWHRLGSWAAPKPVLGWAGAVNLLFALAGSLWFAWYAWTTALIE
jgi:uncharacterized membrane protein YhaH (DUF805 family)